MAKSFLITRPRHDEAVEYLCSWSDPVIEKAKENGLEVKDLKAKKATKRNFWKNTNKAQFIMINGHGNTASVTGHNNKTLIEIGGKYKELKGKIIYARSCQTAKRLGPYLVSMGVKAYIGFDDDYIIMVSEEYLKNPLDDKTAELFLEPSNAIAINLLHGKKVEIAQTKSMDMMKKNFDYLLKSKIKNNREAAAYLWHDIKHQKALGDMEAKIGSV